MGHTAASTSWAVSAVSTATARAPSRRSRSPRSLRSAAWASNAERRALALPTADSSHLPLSTLVLHRHRPSAQSSAVPTIGAIITDDLDLLHVSAADFKIRCATDLLLIDVRRRERGPLLVVWRQRDSFD